MAVMSTLRLFCLLVTLLPSLNFATTCGAHQVLFQSKAYAESLLDGNSKFQGGSIITAQSEWQEFLTSFRPNVEGENLVRTDIDFGVEKVVIATYSTSATCQVDIDDVRLECSDDLIKIEMDVFDASLGCNIKCMALGQVVYVVSVPRQMEIESSDIVIEATGPCVETTETSSTEEMVQKFELIQYSLEIDECDIGECISPNGTCAGEVSCFVDPCDVNDDCEEDEICQANYCGGCHAVCIGVDESIVASSDAATTVLASTPTDEVSTDFTTSTGATSVGTTTVITTTISTTDDMVDGILLDTTTSSSVNSDIEVDEETDIEESLSNNVSPLPEQPKDEELCGLIRVAFKSSAFSRSLVPGGKSGSNVTIVTSQDEMDELLMEFTPMTPDADTTELQNIDFATEQVIFASHYESSTCNLEVITADFVCERATINIGMALLDESAGCEVKCDAEGQVVYSIIAPAGAHVSLGVIVNGPCLEAPKLDSVSDPDAETELEAQTSSTEAASTTSTPEVADVSKAETEPTNMPDSGNLPEGIPRVENSSVLPVTSTFVLATSTFLLVHLSWRL